MSTVDNTSILKEAAAKFLSDDNIILKPTSGGVNNVVQVSNNRYACMLGRREPYNRNYCI